LKGKENFYKFINGDALSSSLVANLKILAIDTPKVA